MRLPRASTLLALGRGGLPRASPRLSPSMRAASEGVREGEVGVYGPPIPGQAHDKRWGPSYVLNGGTNHPMIGFGTYKVGFIPASENLYLVFGLAWDGVVVAAWPGLGGWKA